MENVLLASELVKNYHKDTVSARCAVKIDISKAFDSVQWHFLLSTLKVLGFPERFIHWLKLCFTTASFSVQVNGELVGFFRSTREKTRSRISCWTARHLSFAGRLQLIVSVIHSLTNFWISAFRLPKKCIEEIDKLCVSFLWSGPELNPKKAKVIWKDVCKPKEEGSLGLRSISEANKYDKWSSLGRLFDIIGPRGSIDLGIPIHSTMETVLATHRTRTHQVEFLNEIEEAITSQHLKGMSAEEDMVLWQQKIDKFKARFTSKETWRLILEEQPRVEWYKGIWFTHNTPKYAFMVWLAA
ncbi:putative ribonuclease H protein [Cardamine amara subsp. amara]|uniref:Ribonuclease H protein n=1 Tax=Cardamine amara subsp. amara TaxID=228776 RepID=A0ABD1A3J9_CARAN